jgi:uncharacterized protein involved in exopolysaccharide biosynthesis
VTQASDPDRPTASATPVLDWLLFLATHWRLLTATVIISGAAGLGLTYLMTPVYTARASLLPPQQQNAAAVALGALGSLSGLSGGALGLKTPSDQYVSLMLSTRVANNIVDAFDLQRVYDAPTRTDARKTLEDNSRIGTSRKDTLITIEVDDPSAERAAAIANRYIDELRTLSGQLALTEAQQRRAFFGRELQVTKERLSAAQSALEGSGFNAGALRAEPKSAAEAYARLKAEVRQTEVQLHAVRRNLTDDTPEVQRQIALLTALRGQLGALERAVPPDDGADYISRYREYKYQEALFEIFSRQYETARLDESREGTLIQVVDAATAPERRARPKRKLIAMLSATGALAIMLLVLSARFAWLETLRDPSVARRIGRPS